MLYSGVSVALISKHFVKKVPLDFAEALVMHLHAHRVCRCSENKPYI